MSTVTSSHCAAHAPTAIQRLTWWALADRFVIASLLTNALFWKALGMVSVWLFNRHGVDTHL